MRDPEDCNGSILRSERLFYIIVTMAVGVRGMSALLVRSRVRTKGSYGADSLDVKGKMFGLRIVGTEKWIMMATSIF